MFEGKGISMDNMKDKFRKVSILFIIIFLLYSFFPFPTFGSEKIFRNSLEMEFILIPAGSFLMGSPSDEPHRADSEEQHRVTISRPYYIQTTEVTLKQWWAIMGKKIFGRRKGPDHLPVVKVSWYDCKKFIKKINRLNEGKYRLVTEAEWEYACRAGSTTAYSWGNTIDCHNAMYGNNSKKSKECLDFVKSRGLAIDRPAPVKSYPPNAWGLYDMHGNVWEWCQDWWGDYPTTAITDPGGPDSGTGKVRRGGSWFKHGYSCRSANRTLAHPSNKFQTTGFRLIWSKEADWIEDEEREKPTGFIREQDGP